MKDWSTKRRVSFVFHAIVVAIPFTVSTVSAALFWYSLFASWWLAVPMVVVVDMLALSGLVLYVLRIDSPFTALRHALPFISIVPLGIELYTLLAHNGNVIAGIVAAVASVILVAVAWQCFATIERLFIPSIEAARERAREQMQIVRVELARLEEMQSAADTFARERLNYHAPVMAARVPEQVQAYPEPVQVLTETTKASYECPNCGTILSLGAYGSAKRYGHCKACK